MHQYLRQALLDLSLAWERTDQLRTDDEALLLRDHALRARRLMLHNATNDEVEKFLDEVLPPKES